MELIKEKQINYIEESRQINRATQNRLYKTLQVVKECIKKLDDKILKNKGGLIDDK